MEKKQTGMVMINFSDIWIENEFYLPIRDQVEDFIIGECEIGTDQSPIMSEFAWSVLMELGDILKTSSQFFNAESPWDNQS